ncbi:MAG: PDZ domain-containing protein [Planctomycetes bacterium]|nr:PDZ domain-containing protein [Planctomycetota bacterium]
MPPLRLTVLSVLLAFAAGIAAGLFIAKARLQSLESSAPVPTPVTAPEPAPEDPAPPVADGASAESSREAEDSRALEAALKEVAELEALLAEAGIDLPQSMDPQAAAKKVAELRKQMAALIAKKDGKGLMGVMRALAKLGPAGYASAAQIAELLARDVASGRLEFGLNTYDFQRSLTGAMVPVLNWALQHPDAASPWLRAQAASWLPWRTGSGAATSYLNLLKAERDPAVAAQLAAAIANLARPDMAGAIEAAALANAKNPQALETLLKSLGALKGDKGAQALESLSHSSDPAVAGPALMQLLTVRPPAPGILVTTIVPKSQAEGVGMLKGDIITTYGEIPVTSLQQLRAEIGKVPANRLVTVMVNRNGQLIPVQIKAGQIGIDGKYVAPK